MKELVAKGEGSSFKPGFTWGGEFSVPSYRTGGWNMAGGLECRGLGIWLMVDYEGMVCRLGIGKMMRADIDHRCMGNHGHVSCV